MMDQNPEEELKRVSKEAIDRLEAAKSRIGGATANPPERALAMRKMIVALDQAINATDGVAKYHPRLANICLKSLARLTAKIAHEELR